MAEDEVLKITVCVYIYGIYYIQYTRATGS